MVLSLLQAKTFVLEVMPQLRSLPTWTILPQPRSLLADGEDSFDSLSCRSATIKGRPYLSELTLGQLTLDQPTSSQSCIPIVSKAIRGVQFALGRFGLRGVRIWYENGSFSPWLGETEFCWIGTVRCCDLSSLRVITDVSCPCLQTSSGRGRRGLTRIQKEVTNCPTVPNVLTIGVASRQDRVGRLHFDSARNTYHVVG